MANINDTIRAALDAFVTDLSSLIQEAALESVEQALAEASTIPGRSGVLALQGAPVGAAFTQLSND